MIVGFGFATMGSLNDFSMSLYRTYRPQTFAHLVGQNHVSQTISNALKLDRVNHAYLFTGPRGTGKTSTARLLAKAINCPEVKESEPCNACDICQEISEGRLIDIIEIDAASNRGIDEIRDLREKINFAPTRAKAKVYIIDEVHMLTKEAFNALLKTLEEPPSHVYFVLATTEVHKIPETILSRCQRFDFKRIDDKAIIGRLQYIAEQEKIQVEEKALEVIAHHAEGGLRDAIGLLEQLTTDSTCSYENVCSVLGVSGIESLEKLYGFLEKSDTQGALKEIHDLYMEGHDLAYFNKRFLEFLRKRMLQSIEENQNQGATRILGFIERFQEAYDHSRYATIPQLPLEIAIIQSCSDGTPIPQEAPPAPTEAEQERPHKSLSEPVSPPTQQQPAPPEMMESAEKKSPEIGTVEKQWTRIAEHIKSPIARRSFQQSSLLGIDGITLLLAFATQFHLEKTMEKSNRNDIEHAISEVLGFDLKLRGEVRKIEAPAKTEIPEVEEKAEESPSEGNLAKEVMDMFQGELA